MPLYREQALVLRTYKLGETDRIVVALGPNRGKIRAVAKGVRRPGSRFGGRLEPFTLVDLQLYEGRNLDIVSQAETVTSHRHVREDWERSACASTMVEAADRVAQEGERSARLFLLLRDALGALEAGPLTPALLVDAFLLRLASVSGFHPALDACVTCEQRPGEHFNPAAGGVQCSVCAPVGAHRFAAGERALVVELLTAPWAQLATRGGPGRALPRLVHAFYSQHVGRELAAWDLVPR